MLLTSAENGFLKKSGKIPSVWFAEKRRYFADNCPGDGVARFEQYLHMHLIPTDPALWEMDRFEDFIEARKVLIHQKFLEIGVISKVPLPSTSALTAT